MNMQFIRGFLAEWMQHPRAPLVGLVLGSLLLIALFMRWWSWQETAHQSLIQARSQQQQLQLIVAQLPANAALVSGGDAMMAHLSRHPLPASLQGKVTDIRVLNNQLKGQIYQANARELFAWLDVLSQSGLLISTLELNRSDVGFVSGSLVWGSL